MNETLILKGLMGFETTEYTKYTKRKRMKKTKIETARNLDFKGLDESLNHRKGAALQWKVASRKWTAKRQ